MSIRSSAFFLITFLFDLFKIFIFVFLCIDSTLPNINNTAKELFKSQYIEYYDNENRLIEKSGDQIEIIDIDLVSKNVINALISIEDKNFFKHKGIDYKSMLKNLYWNLANKRIVGGGSTISQQLSKNILQNQEIVSSTDKTLLRKIKEIILTYKLEKKYSKKEILYLYLNRVYFGKNCYGIEAASKFYFKKSSTSLNLYESTLLISLLQSPSKYSSSKKRWRKRNKMVLNKMQSLNFIRKEEVQEFENFKIPKYKIKESNIKYFINYVHQNIPAKFKNKDLKIMTTFDSNLYKAANESMIETQNEFGSDWNSDAGAFIILEKNGAIRVLIGDLDYSKSNFNIATSSKRPSGSIAKYYTYLTAMEMGLNPKSLVEDHPYSFGNWSPSNHLHKTVGRIQVDVAFAQSVNSVALRILEIITPIKVINLINKLDIDEKIKPNLSLTLGGLNTSLLNLTRSTLPIINKGYMPKLYCINIIKDMKTGEILYKNETLYEKKISQRACYYMWQIMKRTISEHGTGRKLLNNSGIFAGKSGTSNSNKDLYFLLLSSNYSMGCWFGRKDYGSMTNLQKNNLCIIMLNKFLERSKLTSKNLNFDLKIDAINIKKLIELELN